jgi:hypothetical protein
VKHKASPVHASPRPARPPLGAAVFVTLIALLAASCVADAILRDVHALGGPDLLAGRSPEDRWIARLVGAPLPFWVGLFVIGRLPRSRGLLERVLAALALVTAAHVPIHLLQDRSFGVLEVVMLVATLGAFIVAKGARFRRICDFYTRRPFG